MNAIIIEDNSTKILLLEHLLEPHFERLIIVKRGKKALNAIRKTIFNYVFLDHDLPDCKGSEMLGEIRKLQPHAKYITISNQYDVLLNYRTLGYDDALQPPYIENVNRIINVERASYRNYVEMF